MRIFSGFTMFFYTVVFLVLGCIFIALAFKIIPLNDVMLYLEYIYGTFNVRLSIGLVGTLLILYSIVAVQVAMGTIEREKTIAFENPHGTVSISLSAIEDFIRKTAAQIHEIREVRPNVAATKKGINIVLKVSIHSDANIPYATEKMQDVIKNKIQEMLGIEEPINLKVHISKIVAREGKHQQERPEDKKPMFKGIEYGG